MSRTTITRECRTLSKILSSISRPHRRHYHDLWPSHPSVWIPAPKNSKHSMFKRAVHASSSIQERETWVDSISFEEDKTIRRKLKDDLRALLREIAQPVAVVTSYMPTNESGASSSAIGTSLESKILDTSTGIQERYHGATLSSFTSIAMDPYPLVAFALRIPSRMATTLSSMTPSISTSPSTTSHTSSPPSNITSHMVVNLLSASQASEAIAFSRPDLCPTPFTSTSDSEGVKYSLSEDGLPILHGVVGALSCKLVGSPIPLYDLDYFVARGGQARDPMLKKDEVASELYIARVVRVENVKTSILDSEHEDIEERERTLPLIYHRRSYTSCHPGTKKV